MSFGYKIYLNDVSKLLARQVLDIDLPKFSGDVKEWPTFITTYRRTTKDCNFSESEDMERLRKCLLDPPRNCVRMILLTYYAEKAIAMLEKNYGGYCKIIEQLMEEVRLQKQVKDSSDFQEFSYLVENLAVTVENVGKSQFHEQHCDQRVPEYLRVQWRQHMMQIRSDDVDIPKFAAWVNAQNNVISKVEIGNEARPTEVKMVKEMRTQFERSIEQ
jgi:hypothetical protein